MDLKAAHTLSPIALTGCHSAAAAAAAAGCRATPPLSTSSPLDHCPGCLVIFETAPPPEFFTMRRFQVLLLFLALSASLMCSGEAARGRSSNQNSFRRAANGVYQTLSSVFGEDNMRGTYKVSGLSYRLVDCFDHHQVERWRGGSSSSGGPAEHRGCHFGALA